MQPLLRFDGLLTPDKTQAPIEMEYFTVNQHIKNIALAATISAALIFSPKAYG